METQYTVSSYDSKTEYTTVWTFIVRGEDEVTVQLRVGVAEDQDCSIGCPDWGGMRSSRTVGRAEARRVYRGLLAKGFR